MSGDAQRRFDRQWKLSATFLGLFSLVFAGLLVQAVDVPSSWELVAYLATIVFVLVLGTLWLVPRSANPRRHSRAK